MIHRSGGTAVIETRRMWHDSALPGEVHPTRALNADVIDHLIYDERGIVSCRCPQTGQIRQMAYHGVEKTRQTLKYHGPAAHYGFECLGRKQCYRDAGTPTFTLSSGTREVLMKTIFVPLAPCHVTPISGNDCTPHAMRLSVSMPARLETSTCIITESEDSAPCSWQWIFHD